MHTGYAAFLDVLGFSSLVAGENHSVRIDNYLQCLSGALDSAGVEPQGEYVVFSDSIVLTTSDDSEESLRRLLKGCSRAFGMMLKSEIPIRGAIAHGTYISEKTNSGRFVAGRAIVEAYQFEEKQDWIGIMLTPSIVRKIPDLANLCLYEPPSTPDALKRLTDRLPWPVYVQACHGIPFHGSPLDMNDYDGFAVVPTDGRTNFNALYESLCQSVDSLERLKSLAPDPIAQAKYSRSLGWLRDIQNSWRNVTLWQEQIQKAQAQPSLYQPIT